MRAAGERAPLTAEQVESEANASGLEYFPKENEFVVFCQSLSVKQMAGCQLATREKGVVET